MHNDRLDFSTIVGIRKGQGKEAFKDESKSKRDIDQRFDSVVFYSGGHNVFFYGTKLSTADVKEHSENLIRNKSAKTHLVGKYRIVRNRAEAKENAHFWNG